MKYTEEEKKALEFLINKRDESYGLMQFEDGELYQLAKKEFNNYLTIEEIIDKQQKEIERLENKDKEYIKILNNNLEWQEKYKELKNDSIPKDKIIERIDTFFDNLIFAKDINELKKSLKEELLGDE